MENQAVQKNIEYKPHNLEEDQRGLCRIPVRENEGMKALVHIPATTTSLKFNIIDISTMGFGIESCELIDYPFKNYDQVQVELSCKNNVFNFTCIICHTNTLDDQRTKLGLLRLPQNIDSLSKHPPDRISIAAITRHQHYYNEYLVLKITDISKKNFTIECNDPELLVFPSMAISFVIHIFSEKGDEITGQVTWIENPEKGKTRFGIEIQHITENTHKMMARYLFHLHDWKPRDLRKMGFSCRDYRPLIKFRSLRTHEEYVEVLKLRKLAYVGAQKIDKNCAHEDLASELDRKSRILVAYHQDKLVGTVSIIFPDHQEMMLDTEKVFENGYRIELPPKVKMIEIARLCITPDYRATDILYGMFEHIYRILITSGREYIISSTDEHMWPLYKKIGFKKVGLPYEHPVFKGIKHDIMLLQKNSLLYSKGISPLVWGTIFMNITDHLIETGAFYPIFYQNFRIKLNKKIMRIFEINKAIKRLLKN